MLYMRNPFFSQPPRAPSARALRGLALLALPPPPPPPPGPGKAQAPSVVAGRAARGGCAVQGGAGLPVGAVARVVHVGHGALNQ